jgi:recombination protein RecT
MSKQISVIEDLRNSIDNLKPQIKLALPAHIPVDRFARVLMTAISTTPALAQANRTTLFGACLKLAQQGLLPDGKEAAIVTFRTKDGGTTAQAMPMVSGILKLVRNSGELSTLSPHVVYENDEFTYYIDQDGEKLKHVPNLKGARGEITHAYCVARTKDGGTYIEVMSKEEIDSIRKSSRAAGSGPWTSWYGEMAKKSVIRRLAKRLPMSTDLDDAIKVDDDLYDLDKPPVVDAAPSSDQAPEPAKPVKAAAKGPKNLNKIIETKSEPVVEHTEAELESPAALEVDENEVPI